MSPPAESQVLQRHLRRAVEGLHNFASVRRNKGWSCRQRRLGASKAAGGPSGQPGARRRVMKNYPAVGIVIQRSVCLARKCRQALPVPPGSILRTTGICEPGRAARCSEADFTLIFRDSFDQENADPVLSPMSEV